jgi:hypothetical protein
MVSQESHVIFLPPGPAMPTMVQSPPQITSPSLQQSQFNFPPPAIPQPVNQVRPVSQPPAVIPQQPPAPIFIQPTQIMTASKFACLNLFNLVGIIWDPP